MSAQEFFRQEAVASQRRSWLGEIHLAQSLPRWVAAVVAITFAVVLMLFICFGKYTRREKVTGQLMPEAGLLTMTSSVGGRVTRVWKNAGQAVKRGEPLMEISGEVDSSSMGNTLALVSDQMNMQKDRLKSDLLNQRNLFDSQRTGFIEKQGLLREQLSDIDQQLAIQQREVASAKGLLARIMPLRGLGYVSEFQFKQQETEMLDAQAQYRALSRQRLDLRQQLDSVTQQLRQLPMDAATQRHDTERKLADADQALAHNEAQRSLILRAPEDGVISSVLLKAGQMTTVGQSVLFLLPQKATLQAQLWVPSRAAGFVARGSRVILRYQAFPYQKFGQQYGRVDEVSRSVLSPGDVQIMTGQQVQEPLYRVVVTLEQQYVSVYGRPEALRAGMALDADILLDRRRLIEWLFEPLYGLRREWSADRAAHGYH